MKRKIVAALIVVNVMLLIALAVKPAKAQFGANVGSYMITTGRIQKEATRQPVYLLDTNSGILLGVQVNSQQKLTAFVAHDIARDLKNAPGAGN